MRRREFLGGLFLPTILPVHAQTFAVRRIAFLNSQSADTRGYLVAAFLKALQQQGFQPGVNLDISYRWAQGDLSRLGPLARELLALSPDVIFASGGFPSALAVKETGTKIPLVFTSGSDPVKVGLVESLHRPSGNITGVSFLNSTIRAKQLELLRRSFPARRVFAIVSDSGIESDDKVDELTAAAKALEIDLLVFRLASFRGMGDLFAALVPQGEPLPTLLNDQPAIVSRRAEIAAAAKHWKVPVMSSYRESPEAGLLMSYGASQSGAYEVAGEYVGKLLRGARVQDLPVFQSTKLELIISRAALTTLGISLPADILALADEVIE